MLPGDEPEGIARSMLSKLGVSSDDVSRELSEVIDKFPKVSGSTVGDAFISPRTKDILDAAFTEAAKMKDQYVSIEHIFLAISDEKKVKKDVDHQQNAANNPEPAVGFQDIKQPST